MRFDSAFKAPEMVKPRPCVVISKGMKARPDLCTIVALSTTPPNPVMPYNCEIEIGLEMPAKWASKTCWVKGDMIYAVGFHRVDLLRIGKDDQGRRLYQQKPLSPETFAQVQGCVLAGLGLPHLTKWL